MARFAPHAPTADRLRVTELVKDEVIGMPKLTKEEAGEELSNDEAVTSEGGALPELEAQWRLHETDPLVMPDPPDAGTNPAKGALPLWLQPQSNKKD